MDLVALVVLEERGLPEALSGAGSEWKEGPAYVVLVCFFLCHKYTILSHQSKKERMLLWILFMNTRRKLGQTLGT
jgi:hypothetical protein